MYKVITYTLLAFHVILVALYIEPELSYRVTNNKWLCVTFYKVPQKHSHVYLVGLYNIDIDYTNLLL